MLLEDEDDIFVGSPKSKFFDVVFNASKNVVEDELEKHIDRFAAYEVLLEKLSDEMGMDLESELNEIMLKNSKEVNDSKIDFYLSTVGKIVAKSG